MNGELMPLYLVRWPGLEASIVRADDEDHLTDILDEVASPTEASWTEYDGALWIDVSPGLEARREEGDGEMWTVRGAEKVADQPWLGAVMQDGDSETAAEMMAAIFEGAFPNLAKVIEEAEEEKLDPKKVRAAAMRDLAEHEPSGVLPGSLLALEEEEEEEGRGRNGGG